MIGLIISTVTVTPNTSLVTVTPNTSLPGSNAIMNLIGGLDYFVIALAVLGALLSAGAMAIGNHSSNGRLADRGKTGLITAIVVAVIAGSIAAIINFAVATGGKIH